MGVSLGYFTDRPVKANELLRLQTLASEANESYEWWCESLWIADKADDNGSAFGFTKLFRMIDDEDCDTYMAYLDICEIVRLLQSFSKALKISWRLEIEGAPFGKVGPAGPDPELQSNLPGFLEMFPGDFESLRARSRADILLEWADE